MLHTFSFFLSCLFLFPIQQPTPQMTSPETLAEVACECGDNAGVVEAHHAFEAAGDESTGKAYMAAFQNMLTCVGEQGLNDELSLLQGQERLDFEQKYHKTMQRSCGKLHKIIYPKQYKK